MFRTQLVLVIFALAACDNNNGKSSGHNDMSVGGGDLAGADLSMTMMENGDLAGADLSAAGDMASLPFTGIGVLGQPNLTTSLNLERGRYLPTALCVAGGKLFVADSYNHRVLGWNSVAPASGAVPDLVLGQATLDTNAPGSGAGGLNQPFGCGSDGTHFFVSDSQNHRVLGWNAIPTTKGQVADFVLGQTSFTAVAANQGGAVGPTTMSGTGGITSDGTRLFVADYGNNRVLVWNSIPTQTAAAANFALGQPDLTHATSGLTATTMAAPNGIATDGTHLFVADSGNYRVLGWNTMPTASGTAADFVLGQADLTHKDQSTVNASTLGLVESISLSGTTLAAADATNSRILLWSGPSLPSSTVPATTVVGAPDFTTKVAAFGAPTATRLGLPEGVLLNGGKLLVGDTFYNRVLGWNSVPSPSPSPVPPPDFLLGEPSYTNSAPNEPGVTASSIDSFGGLQGHGAHLLLADGARNRVLIWNQIPTIDNQPADVVLGRPDFTTTNASPPPAANTLNSPYDVSSDGTHLFVADDTNNRVLIWNTFPTSNATPADVVLGQTGFDKAASGTSATRMSDVRAVFGDGTHLFIADGDDNRVLMWNTLPTTNGQAADLVLGQPDFTHDDDNNGGISGSSMLTPTGLYGDGTHLFVVDSDNHRVLVWNTMPTTNGQTADFALGQADLTHNSVNGGGAISASTLNKPLSVTSDGTKLFVSDTGNSRVLSWSALPTTSGQAATGVFGQADFASGKELGGGGMLSGTVMQSPAGLFSDGVHVFILDTGSQRALVVPSF